VAVYRDGEERPALILDAGTGVRDVTPLLDGAPFQGTILLTHLHLDHVQGLPFFGGADREDARVRLLVPEQEDGTDPVSVLARAIGPPYFPVTTSELRGEWSVDSVVAGELTLEGLHVLALEVPHKGGRTFGYRITDGQVTIAYIPDHCPTALGPGPDGFGEYHRAALELTEGVDLLLHDSQIFPGELARDGKYGHAVTDYAVALGRVAEVRTVVLFHHRPDRTDRQLAELEESLPDDVRATMAVQGQVLTP
jgi:ribonuclease BN (tRNA processing enzyme)